jgi:hypothetical protein
MRIRRRYMPALAVAGVAVGVGLALLLALFVSVGVAHAVLFPGDYGPGNYCTTDMEYGLHYCCSLSGEDYYGCWGPAVEEHFGCPSVTCQAVITLANPLASRATAINGFIFHPPCFCGTPTGGDTWLADVCEPYDGFSADGAMTWDSNFGGPLEFGPSMDGPWYEVEVNGPPWVVTEENMESFAAMVGVDDWHDMWVRSGEGYPQHVGNTVMQRDARMDEICQ